MAGVAGLEPVTSAVTGQRSNQLSYAPARVETLGNPSVRVKPKLENIRAADAKEVGVGNPAEETCCHPNEAILSRKPSLSTVIGGGAGCPLLCAKPRLCESKFVCSGVALALCAA